MLALYISGATCLITLGGGLIALWLTAQRSFVLAFGAGALIAGALMEVVPDALELLESTKSSWHHHHLLFACTLGFLCFYLLEWTAHNHSGLEHAHHHTPTQPAGAWGALGIGIHSFLDGFAIGGPGSNEALIITLAAQSQTGRWYQYGRGDAEYASHPENDYGHAAADGGRTHRGGARASGLHTLPPTIGPPVELVRWCIPLFGCQQPLASRSCCQSFALSPSSALGADGLLPHLLTE